MKEYLSEKEKRQLELFSKYHKLNKETKTFEITFNYHSPEDVIDASVGSVDAPRFDDAILDKVNRVICKIHPGYKANLTFNFDECGAYDLERIKEAFNDGVELDHYIDDKNKTNKIVIAIILFVTGLGFSLLNSIVGGQHNWYLQDGDRAASILRTIFDCFCCVLIWESVSVLFLSFDQKSPTSQLVRKKLVNIYFKSKKENICVCEKEDEAANNWEFDGKLRTAGRFILLICSAGFIAIGTLNLIDLVIDICLAPTIYEIITNQSRRIVVTLFFLLNIFLTIFPLFSGIAGIVHFVRPNKVTRVLVFVGAILSVLTGIGFFLITFYSYDNSLSYLVKISIMITIFVGFFVGFIIEFAGRRKEARRTSVD